MRLASFLQNGNPVAGVIVADATLMAAQQLVPGAPSDMIGIVEAGPELWQRLRSAAATSRNGTAAAQAQMLAPIPHPRRDVFAVG
jgi:hypothetical protein